MAWSTPKTWVDQETPSADDFNTEIRDNLNVLSTHSHSGAAGDGSTTLDSVDYIDLDEGGALSAPAGGHTRFAANNDGTLRYYADGGSEKTVSDTAHSHTIASSTETKASLGTTSLTSTSYTNTTTATFTPTDSTGSAKYVTVHFGQGGYRNVTGTDGTIYIRLLKAGVQTVEVSATIGASVGDGVAVYTSTVYISPTATSTTFAIEHKKGGTHSSVSMFGLGTIARQVRCQ